MLYSLPTIIFSQNSQAEVTMQRVMKLECEVKWHCGVSPSIYLLLVKNDCQIPMIYECSPSTFMYFDQVLKEFRRHFNTYFDN